ncbi:hypothetical protein LOZ63_000607 [Ophidiomyces ophidiicola]|nr:hypothetical protein LOZ63_000607 [Ophidiomyces ophidiicola]
MDLTQEVFANRVKTIFESGGFNADTETWDTRVRQHVHFHSASLGPPARASFRAIVAPSMCNQLGNLHGGCAATLIDVLSSMLPLALQRPGIFSYGGVSRAWDVKYLRGVPEGVEMEIICEVGSLGRRLAMFTAEIRRVDNGELCVIGLHDKANTDPKL